jgi:hypothetical protein
MESRPLTYYETWFASSIQFAVEMRSARLATEFADYLIRSIAGFRMRRDATALYRQNSPVEVATIPPELKTSRDVTLWADAGLRPLVANRVAAIAVRDTHVALSVNHVAFDGVSFILLMDRFLRGEFQEQPVFPIPVDVQIKDLLAASLNTEEHRAARLRLASLPWTSPRSKTGEDDSHCDFIIGELTPSTVKCYNPKTDRFVGLTDVLWRSSILAAHALHPQKHYGCFTWVNIRPYIKVDTVGFVVGPCSMIAEGVTDDLTIGEFQKRLRRDFTDKIKRRYWLNGVKLMATDVAMPRLPNSMFDVSNVGYFPIKGPFVDACGQMTPLASQFTPCIGLSSVTTFGNENAKLTLRYPYSQFVFTRSDAVRAYKAIVHSIQYIGLDVKIGDAIREMRQVAV